MRLLVLEDDPGLRSGLVQAFKRKGYAVTGAAGLGEIPEKAFDYAIVDLRLGTGTGLDALELLRRRGDCRAVVLTGYGSIATAVQAVRLGAVNFLTKPAEADAIEDALLGRPPKKAKSAESPMSLSRHEDEYIDYVLQLSGGNISRAARVLGLHRQSLQRKLKRHRSAG